jgi:hypothetical protein
MRVRLGLFVSLYLLPTFCQATEPTPRDLLLALNALRIDSQAVYTVSPKDRIELHQADTVISLQDGKIAFFQPFEGRITGLVFSGLGHALALPREPAEKQQMARFLLAPLLDQQFLSTYVRFTDDTAQDLLAQLQHAGLQPSADAPFGDLWQNHLDRLNPSHSLRILIEKFSLAPHHFFHAGIDGVVTGPFDILADQMRLENLMIGQPRRVASVNYYNVWASYAVPGFKPPPVPFDVLRYRIETSIHTDTSLEGNASVDYRGISGTEQVLVIQLARSLKIDNVSLENGPPLPYFQNEGLTQNEIRSQGDDSLCLFLPKPPAKDEVFTLHFRYRGNIIENAGNGVLQVGARESWYPHFGGTSEFALYDLTFRWPKHLRLVATGEKSDEHEDGDFQVARWKTEQPVTEAGFNLGEYMVSSISSENRSIVVYANSQLEQAVLSRFPRSAIDLGPSARIPGVTAPITRPDLQPPTPSPADALKQLARDVDSSIRFYEQYSGPFPFRHLAVTQIPGTSGQGWPGLLYLSTFSFLPQEAQRRAGITSSGQELFTDIIPFHEVAHQWWGNVVGWSSYRDQWIDESIAAYLSLCFADSQKNPDHTLHAWLDRYRKRLVTKSEGSDMAPADIGPLIMGTRLASSKSPEAYDALIYSKGAWVFHMLREMLRQPGSKEPDTRFTALLRTLVTKYGHAALSTEQLQREVEAVMTTKMDLEGGHSMEWFFEEFVRGTGIPHYKVEFTSRRTDKGFLIRGKLRQSGVPRSFIAPVPLYASSGAGHSVLLGTVLASGEETSFSFHTDTEPRKLQIDPRMTLLCIPE